MSGGIIDESIYLQSDLKEHAGIWHLTYKFNILKYTFDYKISETIIYFLNLPLVTKLIIIL